MYMPNNRSLYSAQWGVDMTNMDSQKSNALSLCCCTLYDYSLQEVIYGH
jgi:hypothetical protein